MKRIQSFVTLMMILLIICSCTSEQITTLDPSIKATVDASIALTTTAMSQPTATAKVDQPTAIATTPTATNDCPFYVHADKGSDLNHYVAEGWMGDISDVTFDDNYQLDSNRPNVIQIRYTPSGSKGWAGIYWWDPPGSNFAEVDGGFDISCASKLTFFARGEQGGEKAEFKVGGLEGTFKDSLPTTTTGVIVFTNDWVQYTLDLAGKDLTHVIGGFVWVTNKDQNPNGATIYIDDIRFE